MHINQENLSQREPWNAGRIIGAKPPLKPKHIWALRTRLQIGNRVRDLAMFNLAIDSKLRGWACDRDDFRDFVLTRIDRIKPGPAADFDPADDFEWENFAKLDLRPHPGLTDEQSLAIQRDYAMKDGRREIDVRLSMAYYFIMRMNLDLSDLPPARAQICLINIDEVRKAIEDAKARSKARILQRKGMPPSAADE
ncbi:site-specific integrase [Xanthobacter autotrophicus]|uniref:hypothetical protein n=1 Tax=Xanthobacter autotrophicus TaxID=280 RepID=UPI00372CADA4